MPLEPSSLDPSSVCSKPRKMFSILACKMEAKRCSRYWMSQKIISVLIKRNPNIRTDKCTKSE